MFWKWQLGRLGKRVVLVEQSERMYGGTCPNVGCVPTKALVTVITGKAVFVDPHTVGVDDLTTHRWPLEKAPEAYSMFQKKEDGAIKVVLKP